MFIHRSLRYIHTTSKLLAGKVVIPGNQASFDQIASQGKNFNENNSISIYIYININIFY